MRGEAVSPPTQSLCPNCGNLFPYRSNKTYCSSNCRKAHSKRQSRRETPVNARYNFTKAREQHEKFNSLSGWPNGCTRYHLGTA